MPMVQVGEMRMHMGPCLVDVGMGVADACRQTRMRMLVVPVVVPMAVRMEHLLVGVSVSVTRRE